MTVSIQHPEDAVNAALARIGYRLRVNSMVDGTAAAALALQLYGQTRDALLRLSNWGFAQKSVSGVAFGTPPAPWAHSFAYPADCLRVRNLFPLSYPVEQNNPLRVLYLVANQAAKVKFILTNEASPVIVYTARITDPSSWEPLFVEALIVALAKRLTPALAQLEVEKIVTEDEKVTLPQAVMTIG